MVRKFLMPTVLGAVAACALIPVAASAETRFGFSVSSGYPGYYAPGYYAPGYYVPDDPDYYYDRRAAWIAHERWEREQARRRHWQHEYWEHHRHHDDDDD
jgi:hypothetical protein